ncbi:copper-binding protein, partial [Vibrio artabrorum]
MKKTLIAIALTLTTATAFAEMDLSMMKDGKMDHS